MRKLTVAAAMVVILTSMGAAAEATFTETATLTPGASTGQVFGNVSVVNDTGLQSVSDTLPFNLSLTHTVSVNNTTYYAATAEGLSDGFPAGSNTGDVFLTYANDTAQLDVSYTVEEVSNWTVSESVIEHDVSTGDSGVFGNLTVRQTGNVGENIAVTVSGNISDYVFTDPVNFQLPAGLPRTVRIGYEVPRDTAAGYYTGAVQLTDGGVTRTVNVSSVFSDREPPRVESVTVPDTMATTPSQWVVEARDNLAVTRVSADVLKEVVVQEGNTTKQVNRSLSSVNFTHSENTDAWLYDFTDTGDITRYYVNVSVRDAAGNSVTRFHRFVSEGLDAVQVVDQNFDMDSIRYQEKGEEVVFVNDVDSPFNVTLDSFSYAGNTSVRVGILPPGADTAEFYSDDRRTLQFSSIGDYRLVVDSREKEEQADTYRFDGRLVLGVPPQHVPVSDVVFGGQVNAEDYPKMREVRHGDFRGIIGYGENAVEEFRNRFGLDLGERQAVFIGAVPADECVGDEYWDNCAGTTLGEANQTAEENQRLRRQNTDYFRMAAGSWIAFLLLMMRVLFAGPMHQYPHTKKKNVEGLRDGN